MKKKKKPSFPMPAAHRKLVDRLSRDLKPVPPPVSLTFQWMVWAILNIALLGLFLAQFHLRSDLGALSFWGAILLMLVGAGLAAYGALEAGVPGEEGRGRWKFWAAVFAWGCALAWTFLALPGEWKVYTPVLSPDSCFAVVLEMGVLFGAILFFFLKKTAPLRPFRAGLWAGASAFLMGLAAVSLHCPSGNLFHILMEHFLPVLVYAFLVALLTAGWLSKWRKKPLSN
ncbi:MAG TPA: NrsF family protein [bacterium]|nr:NrsF family protein [bacterium]